MKKNTLSSVFSHSKKMVTLALAGALTLSLLFTGCGSSKSYAAGDSDYAPAENTKQSWASSPTAVEEEMAQDTAADDGAALTEAGPNQVLQNKNVKLIWFADVTMETLDFEPLIAGIEETVAQYQGYVESSSVSGGNRLTGPGPPLCRLHHPRPLPTAQRLFKPNGHPRQHYLPKPAQ